MDRPELKLRPRADRRIRAGHVWVYSNEVDTEATPLKALPAGGEATLLTHDGKVLGTVVLSPNHLICARLISRHGKQGLTRSLIKRRLEQADARRQVLIGGEHYRMVYGDSDGLPGLVIDRFGADFVIQSSLAALEPWLEVIVHVLASKWSARSVWLKNDGKMRAQEGLAEQVVCAHGPETSELSVTENGVTFGFDVVSGQKTGWFFDHRNNRARLNALIAQLDA
ncbi:MAG: RlmI/RlmK family 23S rRNA methyltransferase, partial [Gammaproteobacteria bacterium]